MTTFPTTPPPLTAPVVNAAGAAVDSRRTVRRATIAELNDLDYDTIRERLQSSRIDDRPSWVKGLDLIDAPRNLLISTVFPSLERKARERGDVGTGGVGKVFGSDVLESAGVSNRVVKAIAGFGLDILTDPLTFLGPAGAGLRVSSKTGQVARVGLRGRRAIDEGLSAVAKGGIGAVRDPDTARLFRTMAEGLDDVPATNQALSQVIGGRLLGPVTSGRVGRALSRVGGEVEHGGGALAELLDKFGESGVVGAQAQAVRDWMARYGAGTGGGLRIGKGATGKTTVAMGPYAPGKPIATSTIAHIPFTDFGIHVPAFTGEGRAAAQQLRIATATNPASPVQGLGPTLAAATPLVREMQDIEASMRAGPADAARTAAVETGVAREAATRTIAPEDAARGTNPRGGTDVTAHPERVRVASEMATAFDPKQAETIAPVMDAYAKTWANATGKDPGEFYKGLRVVKGGKPGEGALMQGDANPQLDTPEFKGWFGDSKVVDKDGKPLVVYHGTAAKDFNEFRPNNRPKEQVGFGVSFTDDPSFASKYAAEEGVARKKGPSRVYPVHLRMNNPINLDQLVTEGSPEFALAERIAGKRLYTQKDEAGRRIAWLQHAIDNAPPAKAMSILQDAGYDGAIYTAKLSGVPAPGSRMASVTRAKTYTVFSPEQIKSATGNSGAFDPKNPSILGQMEGATARGSYEFNPASVNRTIRALTDPNASTLPHEVAHDFLENLPVIDKNLADDAAKALGADSHANLTVPQKEQFARGFEAYLRTGEAPIASLKPVFERFKEWLTNLYRSIVGTPLENQLNPKLKSVFDEMLSRGEREMPGVAVPTAPPKPSSAARITELRAQLDGLLRRHSETPVETATPNGLGEMLALRKVADEADAAAKLAKARASAGGPIDEYASAVHEAMENYARSVRGSVKQFASTQDVETQRMVARMFGTDDDRLGASLLTPVRAVAGMMGDPSIAADITNRVDNAGKAVFGQPPGHLRDMQRAYRNGLSFGSREGYAATESAIRKEIVDVMRAADLNPSNLDDYRAAVQLTTAHMYAIRNKEAAARGADDVFFTKKFGSDEPAEWVQHLQRAQEGGILGKASEQLKQIAQRNVGMLKTMADYEYADDILGIPIEGYISGIPTPAAALEIAKTNRQRMVDKSVRGTMRKAAGEAFQKRKMSYQYRWESPSGGMRRFFEKDRWVQDFPDESIAQIAKESPQDAADIVKLRETINEYDTLAKDPAWAEKHAPRQTDNWEMNELHRNGEFSLLTGSEILPDGFMETNAATLMAGRVMAHERAVARKTWAEYVKQQGVAVDAAKMQGTRQEGNTLLLKDGSVAKFYQDKNGLWGVEQNGQRFRPLRAEFATDTRNPMTETLGDTTGLLYHEDVARAIEDVASVYDEPNELLKFLDSATAAWKTTTLAHPSWTIGNLIGDSVNQLTNGARIADMAQDAGPMMKIIANVHNPEKLKDLWVEGVRGQDIRGDQLVNDLREANLIGTNAVAETALQWHSRGHFILPSLVGGAEGRSFIDQFRPSMLKSDFMERLSHENAARRVAAGARAAGFVAKDRFIRGFLRPWFRVNERMNDYVKALAYLSFLRQGYDMPSATRKVIRAAGDYSDSTRVERDFFKRMWPFYSFMRLNGAYQMKLLLSRPIYAGSFPLLHHAVEEAINGDAKVPLHARPSWMRQQMALQVGSDPNERFALILGNLLPQEQAFAGLSAARGAATLDQQAIADTANYLVGSLNPLVRTPLEVGAGREFFSDRTIGGDPASADLTVGDAILNQIRPIRELPKIAQSFGEQGVGAGLARTVIGGRAQPMSEERVRSSLTREFTDKEQRIRTALRRAERTGDTGARAEANLKLMLLYKAMLERGLQESVPKWARERLADMMPQESAL